MTSTISASDMATARVAAVLDEAGLRALARCPELTHLDQVPEWERELVEHYAEQLDVVQAEQAVTDAEIVAFTGCPDRGEVTEQSLAPCVERAVAAERVAENEQSLSL